MKYKVGDKVRVNELDNYYIEDKRKFANQIVTIAEVKEGYYNIKEDNKRWWWREKEFKNMDKKMFSKEELKFGDIVTLRNEERYIYINKKIINEKNYEYWIETYNEDFTYGDEITKIPELDIMKVERLCQYEEGQFKLTDVFRHRTLYERKEEILTEKEKEYLSAVIKPFRDRRFTISKILVYDKKTEFIFIEFSEDEYISFPYFKKGTMYKGMEVKKEYTLKELGL